MIKVKCKCGKRAFPSEEYALSYIDLHAIRYGRLYQCNYNRAWHITSMTKVTIRKSFGGKSWDVSNGKTTLKEDSYEAARKRCSKWVTAYRRQEKRVS